LKNDVNVPSKRKKEKNFKKKLVFCWRVKVNDEKIAGSGSRIRIRIHSKMSWVRKTAGKDRISLTIFGSLLIKKANNARILIFNL
jgi:hypothetical protein